MSEYQYYEFQSIDRPLNAEERKYISSLSSRTEATSHQAIFTYSWSDFPANEMTILAKYFDALLYISNWGTARLAFRFPKASVDMEQLSQYTYPYSIQVEQHGDKVILDMLLNSENGYGWIEGEGYLSKMIELRSDIMRGDMRAPYLGWLAAASMEAGFGNRDTDYDFDPDYSFIPAVSDFVDDEELEVAEEPKDLTEPPVPPNLQQRSLALETLIDFFQFDNALVDVAAEISRKHSTPQLDIDTGLSKLSVSEKDAYLKRVIAGENIRFELMTRLQKMTSPEQESPSQPTRRTLTELHQQAEALREAQAEQKRLATERKRNQHLDTYLQIIPQTWDKIFFLIDEKRTKAYEEAIDLIVDLRDLAKRDNWQDEFLDKVDLIYKDYPTLRGLHRRLAEKGF